MRSKTVALIMPVAVSTTLLLACKTTAEAETLWLITTALAADNAIPPLVETNRAFVFNVPLVLRLRSFLAYKPDRLYETPAIAPLKLPTVNEVASIKFKLPTLPAKV